LLKVLGFLIGGTSFIVWAIIVIGGRNEFDVEEVDV